MQYKNYSLLFSTVTFFLSTLPSFGMDDSQDTSTTTVNKMRSPFSLNLEKEIRKDGKVTSFYKDGRPKIIKDKMGYSVLLDKDDRFLGFLSPGDKIKEFYDNERPKVIRNKDGILIYYSENHEVLYRLELEQTVLEFHDNGRPKIIGSGEGGLMFYYAKDGKLLGSV